MVPGLHRCVGAFYRLGEELAPLAPLAHEHHQLPLHVALRVRILFLLELFLLLRLRLSLSGVGLALHGVLHLRLGLDDVRGAGALIEGDVALLVRGQVGAGLLLRQIDAQRGQLLLGLLEPLPGLLRRGALAAVLEGEPGGLRVLPKRCSSADQPMTWSDCSWADAGRATVSRARRLATTRKEGVGMGVVLRASFHPPRAASRLAPTSELAREPEHGPALG
jgi:hypothetical protein